MNLERSAPLAVQIARLLRSRLQSEYYAVDSRLPSEPEIAKEFCVSRGTVRQALTILEREGAIYRKQGSGTFANKHVLQIGVRAEHAYEFTDLIFRSGFEATIAPVEINRETPSEEIVERLEIDPNNEVLVVRKLFFADGEPMIFCIDTVPECLIRETYEKAELHTPIFEFLKRRCYQEVSYNLAEIIPEIVNEQLAELLECSLGDAVLRFDETSYNTANQPILFSRIYYKANCIRFTVLRKKV